MAATFPGGIWGPVTLQDGVDEILAAHQNEPNAEIVAIETLLQAYDGKVGRYIEGWVQYDDANPTIGTIAADCVITRVTAYVVEAFDDSGTDLLEVGYDGDHGAYVDDCPVDETGMQVCEGLPGTVDDTERTVKVWYTGQNADATAGKALVVVEFVKVTTTPV